MQRGERGRRCASAREGEEGGQGAILMNGVQGRGRWVWMKRVKRGGVGRGDGGVVYSSPVTAQSVWVFCLYIEGLWSAQRGRKVRELSRMRNEPGEDSKEVESKGRERERREG